MINYIHCVILLTSVSIKLLMKALEGGTQGEAQPAALRPIFIESMPILPLKLPVILLLVI